VASHNSFKKYEVVPMSLREARQQWGGELKGELGFFLPVDPQHMTSNRQPQPQCPKTLIGGEKKGGNKGREASSQKKKRPAVIKQALWKTKNDNRDQATLNKKGKRKVDREKQNSRGKVKRR